MYERPLGICKVKALQPLPPPQAETTQAFPGLPVNGSVSKY